MEISRIPKHRPVEEINEILSKELGFGKIFTDNMFIMKWTIDKGWHGATIQPFQNLSISPAAKMLHYAQGGFEGLKAYSRGPNKFALFRHRNNIERMNRTAERLCMPTIDPADFEEGLIELIKTDIRWIPQKPDQSLYIRPTMIATEPEIVVRASAEYLFFIILSPVGAYFKNGLQPSQLYVEQDMSRVADKSMGSVKAAANYAGSLKASEKSKKNNCAQVLWLDAAQHRFLEEGGAMNIHMIQKPKTMIILDGNILPGITSDTIVQIAKALGIKVVKGYFDINDVSDNIKKEEIIEIFSTGTAAVISPVSGLLYNGENILLKNQKPGPITKKLYTILTDIQYHSKFHGITDPKIKKWITEIEV